MKAFAIIPCLNEEKTIAQVIDKLREFSKKEKIELIILAIDDASNDNTLKILKGKADIVVSLKKRQTLASMIRLGLKIASLYKPDIIIHIDADGQHNPMELSKLLNPIVHGEADFVIGTRFKKNKQPLLVFLGNCFFTKIINFLTGLKLTDAQSGLRIIRYVAIKDINFTSFYTYTHEEILRIAKQGFKISEVSIEYNKRMFGKSKVRKNPFLYFALVFFDIIRVKFQ